MVKKYLKLMMMTSIVSCLLFLFSSAVLAAPHEGDIFQLKQPDNTSVEVKVWGDEFYQRVESLDGYTLIRDPKTNWICYAVLNKDGLDFESTGVAYKGVARSVVTDQKKQKVTKGLKLKKDKILEKAKKVQGQLFVEGQDAATVKSIAYADSPIRATIGNIKGFTMLIDFSDAPATITKQEIDNMINMPDYTGYSNNGSVRDYFYDVSGGKMVYTNSVVGYYRAQKTKAYYNDPNASGRAQELVREALTYFKNSGFDFTTLSKNSNGMVMAVNIFYAGNPDVGWAKGLWPHSGSISSFQVNGGYISRYQMSSIGTSLSIGTFIHENGHMVCGYPDLYDYDYDSKGVGGFCVMCSSGGKNPVPPNAYFRSVISGWGSITDLNNYPNNSQISVNRNSLDVYRYKGSTSNEFFMVESIRKQGRWATMPDEGLAIWHVETNGSNNYQDMTATRHYKVSLEQADGQFHFEKNVSTSSANDLFHYGNADKFNNSTVPNSKWWNGTSSGFDISNISAVADTMTLIIHNNIVGPTSTPKPTSTPTPTATYTIKPTVTATPTNKPVYTPTATPTTKPTITPTSTATPGSSVLFYSGFETGETQPTWSDTIDWSTNVSGYFSTIKPECSIRQEKARTGIKAIMYSGRDNSTTTSYCYYKVFDVNITVTSNTYLSYWIYPQNENGRRVAVDFIMTDGTNLRDSGAIDTKGLRLHPATARGTINTWTQINSNVGKWLNGKTIDRILIAYDQPAATGQYRGYMDEIKIYR